MIFRRVGDGRPYPEHGLTGKGWAAVPPRQVRLDELITTKRALDLDTVTVARMVEAQPERVKPLPVEPQPGRQRRIGAVRQISDARMPDGSQVHADLVRATRLETHV